MAWEAIEAGTLPGAHIWCGPPLPAAGMGETCTTCGLTAEAPPRHGCGKNTLLVAAPGGPFLCARGSE